MVFVEAGFGHFDDEYKHRCRLKNRSQMGHLSFYTYARRDLRNEVNMS